MGSGTSSRKQPRGLISSDECFKRIIDAETLQQTGPYTDQDTDQAMSLTVNDWHSDSPSTYLMLDERPSTTEFEGWLNARDRTVEFQFIVPANYPGRRSNIGPYIQKLLENEDFLGIAAIYLGADAVQQCIDTLRRARRRRPQWSEPITMYGAQFFWMKRGPDSPMVYIKTVVDADETCILTVNETNPDYKDEAGGDAVCLDRSL